MGMIYVDSGVLTQPDEYKSFVNQYDEIEIRLNEMFKDTLGLSKKFKNTIAQAEYKNVLCSRVAEILYVLHRIKKLYPPSKKPRMNPLLLAELRVYLFCFYGHLYGVYESFLWIWFYERNLFRDYMVDAKSKGEPVDRESIEKKFRNHNPFNIQKKSNRTRYFNELFKKEPYHRQAKIRAFLCKHECWYSEMAQYRHLGSHQVVLNFGMLMGNDDEFKEVTQRHKEIQDELMEFADRRTWPKIKQLIKLFCGVAKPDLVIMDAMGKSKPVNFYRRILADSFVLLDFMDFVVWIFSEE